MVIITRRFVQFIAFLSITRSLQKVSAFETRTVGDEIKQQHENDSNVLSVPIFAHKETSLSVNADKQPASYSSYTSTRMSSRKSTTRKLKSKKSEEPSSLPSSIPSIQPSAEPTISPSLEPSLQPSNCRDEPDWMVNGTSIYAGMTCADIQGDVDRWCRFLEPLTAKLISMTKSISQACCDCGGGAHQTLSPSAFPSVYPSKSSAPTRPTSAPTACEDEPGWTFTIESGEKLGCDALSGNPNKLCLAVESIDYDSKPASLACCVCGGGNHLSVAPSESPSSKPSSEPTLMPSVSSAPSDEPSDSPSKIPSSLPSMIPTNRPSVSLMPSDLPSQSFATAFDGDFCQYDRECKERPLYTKSRRLQEVQRAKISSRLLLESTTGVSSSSTTRRNMKVSKKKKAATASPSFVPSETPSISKSPTDNPSEMPSVSKIPSSDPTSLPSSIPSKVPSTSPSTAPSSFPTLEPSYMPSSSPSSIPSSSPSSSPTSVPSPSPSKSIFPSSFPSHDPSTSARPSAMPQHYGRCDKVQNVCIAEDLMVKIVKEMDGTVLEEEDAMSFNGSYGNAEINAKNDATHDQDFYGGVVVHSDPENENDTLTMFGNAWKAYRLSEPFEVTKSSFLKFNYTIIEEAEGHGICLDEDLNEDTFGGTYTRCIMLAGTQVDRWGGIRKFNLASIEGAYAQQKSDYIFLIGDADKAIDGLIAPHWNNNENGVFNSISRTKKEDYPWWEVVLSGEFEIHDIIIHNTQDSAYIDDLTNFTISIHNDDLDSGPDDTDTVWKKTYDGKEAFRKFHIPVRSDVGIKTGKRIRITLNKKDASLQLAEVEIMGQETCPNDDFCTQTIQVPIGDLFAGSKTYVQYISFIQDNDNDSTIGESEFSGIHLKTETPTLLVQNWKRNGSQDFEAANLALAGASQENANIHLKGDKSNFGIKWNLKYNSGSSENLIVDFKVCERDARDDVPQKDLNLSDFIFDYFKCKVPYLKCGRCEGDCDNDDHCEAGLVCQERKKYDSVRSCKGSISNDLGYDFCVLKEKMRRVSCSNDGVMPGISVEKLLPVLKDVDGDAQVPTSIAVSMRGKIVVGYSNFVLDYKVPSAVPSSSPSSLPSSLPSSSQSQVDPTTLDTSNPPHQLSAQGMIPNPPLVDRRFRGAIAVFNMTEIETDFDPYESPDNVVKKVTSLDWVEENYKTKGNYHLLGEFDVEIEDGFASAVAISDDETTIAIGYPSWRDDKGEEKGMVKVLKEIDENWSPFASKTNDVVNTVKFGKLLALSDNGSIMAVVAKSSKGMDVIMVFQWNGISWETIGNNEIEFVTGTVDSLNVSLLGERIIVSTFRSGEKIDSYELVGVCEDRNALSIYIPTNDGYQADEVACICRKGFISALGYGQRLTNENDYCVECMSSNTVIVSSDEFTMTFNSAITFNETYPTLTRREPDKAVSIPLFTKSASKQIDSEKSVDENFKPSYITDGKKEYTFFGLQPGFRYTVEMERTDREGLTELDSPILQCPVVTSCSCDHLNYDRTGRPAKFSIYQENGHIMFEFQDKSKCGDAFSFTRMDGVDEFMTDATKFSTSFTSDFNFNAAGKCVDEIISPALQASDQLTLSNLIVGKKYAYCVRSINKEHYMDHPYDSYQSPRSITSSDATCSSHSVRWEASFHGKVTTEPDAGNLPIENVRVSWNILDADFNALNCDGCKNSTLTTDGGGFNIVFNVDHEYLKGRNADEIPVRIFFHKTSPSSPEKIKHDFLCDDGASPCDTVNGYIVYLSHLQFKEPLHIYDDTSVPFKGKIFIADTVYRGEQGCAIANAEVCIMHNSTGRSKDDVTEEPIVCVDTDPEGRYIAPVVIGSRVDFIKVNYHSHEFEPAASNPGPYPQSSLVIKANDDGYTNNDFMDVAKAETTVEVVGGVCDRFIGISTVLIKILGCDWEGNKYHQSGTNNLYQNIPAHFLHLEVTEIVDSVGNRLNSIYNFFQADPPLVRTVDLLDTSEEKELIAEEEEKAEVGNGDTGTDDEDEEAEKAEVTAEMNKEIEGEQRIVRFQYNGELKMDVSILPRKTEKTTLDCSTYDSKQFGTGDSFHVLPYMALFNVRIDLRYEITEGTFCDIVDDDLQIFIDNQVGIDDPDSESWKIFLKTVNDETKAALTLCSTESIDGTCTLNVTHTTDEENNKLGGAGLSYSFATGRPNIVFPYTKRMIFRILGGTEPVSHTAIFFIDGPFSKGPGNSFALPTYEPIMILRDPPGGSSSASYENIQTTIRVVNSEWLVAGGAQITGTPRTFVEQDPEVCTGGGLGAIVLACKEAGGANVQKQIEFDGNIGTKWTYDNMASNEFTTTWSYSTSDSPERAGHMSDVFVVPNLNMAYAIWYEVHWNNDICSPIREVTGTNASGKNVTDWPSDIKFEVKSEKNKESLSFFSRFQLQDQKIPELKSTLANLDRKLNGKVCKVSDTDDLCAKRRVVKAGLDGWSRAIQVEKDGDTGREPIINWFREYGRKDITDYRPLDLDDHVAVQSSSLISPVFTQGQSKPVSLKNGLSEAPLSDTNRIQFDGGAGQLEMTMSKQKIEEYQSISCWKGCNKDIDFNIGTTTSVEGHAWGFGARMDYDKSIELHIEHTATKGGTDSTSTSVGFSLGDPDLGDEFVVDIFFDKRYGSLIFETVSGRSACPHEAKTLPNEDPQIVISKYAKPFVFPDDPMVFEVEITNMGVGTFTTFRLYPAQSNGLGGVSVAIDGVVIGETGTTVLMLKDTLYKKQVVITRGPNTYQDQPIDITLESLCEVTRDQADLDKLAVVKLSNANDEDGNGIIEWVRPCPKVEWASELKRDKGFLVNLESDFTDRLSVTVMNPDVNNGEYAEKRLTGRLRHVSLKYRKIGTIAWKNAKTFVRPAPEYDLADVDFAADFANEDAYGYVTLDWNIDSSAGVKPGNYEIKVETMCTDLGGPEDINRYETSAIPGAIDLSRPEQYGQPLPLRQDVIPGEEIVVVFSEPLDCSKPFSFDIEVRVSDTVNFDKDNLHVRCEGRTIGFQIKLGSTPYANLLGKDFEVEIGRIGTNSFSDVLDINGNTLEYNIEFQRTFATIDLGSTSSSFRLLLESFPCDKMDKESDISDGILEDVTFLAGLNDPSRITVSEISCMGDERGASARVRISPATTLHNPSSNRRLSFTKGLNGSIEREHAVQIFEKIFKALEITNSLDNSERKLQILENGMMRSYSITDVSVLPSNEDLKKFKTRDDKEEEENILYHFASIGSSSDAYDEVHDFISRELQKERKEMEIDLDKLETKLAKRDEKRDNEVRKEQEEMESKLIKLQATLDGNFRFDGQDTNQQEAVERMFIFSCVILVASAAISTGAFLLLRK